MKAFSLIILLTLISINLISQDISQAKQNQRDNAFYYEVFGPGLFFGSVNYDRLFRIGSNQGIALRAGLSYFDGPFLIGEANYAIGKGNHFGEIGIGTTTFFLLTGEDGPGIFLRAGYRLQGKKGFHFRLAPSVFLDDKLKFLFVWPAASVGYCF